MIHHEATTMLMEEFELGVTNTDKPWFTGWKFYGGIMGPKIGCIGQLVQWRPSIRKLAYVNLPGMESGMINAGESFDVGNERLSPIITMEEMRELFVRGLDKLKELVESNEGTSDAEGSRVRDLPGAEGVD